MVKKIKSLLSVFGASGYRYSFSLFSFDNVFGVEDAFPDEGAVYIFVRRACDFLRFRNTYEYIYCSATKDLSALSIGELSKKYSKLLDANCVGVLFEKDSGRRNEIVTDILRRNLNNRLK